MTSSYPLLSRLILPLATSFITVLFSLFAQAESAPSLSALEIMQRVNTADMGDRVSQNILIIRTDKRGRERQQEARSFRKRTGEGTFKETRSIMFFVAPEKMLNTAFLTVDYDNPAKEDKQWIYLPTSKQTKRIAGNDKRLSFMGTDFSHADMALRNVHNYHYKILREEKTNNHPAWIIEGTPLHEGVINEDGYIKSIVTVRQDNFMVMGSINTLKKGGRTKTMEVFKLEQIDGVWVQSDVVMSTFKGGTLLSQTRMKTDNVKFHRKLDDKIFTVRSMEAGLSSIE